MRSSSLRKDKNKVDTASTSYHVISGSDSESGLDLQALQGHTILQGGGSFVFWRQIGAHILQ